MFANKSYQKLAILLILIFTLALGSFTAYGESMFKDMKESHWAYEHVEKVVNLGLMDGYDDGTFRPNDLVSTGDVLMYITRLLNVSKAEIKAARERYNPLLSKFQLSEGRKDGLALALSKGIVTEIFVENNLFTKDGMRNATKTELCIYIVKAMGMEEDAKKEIPIFLYRDSDKIPERARPYIKFLIKKGILDEKGDGEGNFNPDQPIIRSVLAKILDLSYGQMDMEPEVILQEPVEELEEEPVDVREDYNQLVGIVIGKVGDFIFIDNGLKVDSFKFVEDAEIIIDSSSGTVEDLQSGMNIKAKVSGNNIIDYLEVNNDKDTLLGTIKKMSLGDKPFLTIEVQNKEILNSFHISKETKLSIDGKKAYLYNLKEGNFVKIEAIDNLAISIAAESKDGKVEGVIKDKNFDKESILTVEREDQSLYEYKIEDSTSIIRNSKKATNEDLRRGDKIILTLAQGKVKSIEAESTLGEDQGYIKAILISDEPKLTILNDSSENNSYYISKTVAIKIDKEFKNVYDLRLNHYVNLKLESDEIVNIDIEK